MTLPIAVEPVVCESCGSAGPYRDVASGPDFDYQLCGAQEFRLVECAACGACFLNPRPTAAMLPVIYAASDYYAYEFAERGHPIVVRARRARDRQKVAQVLAHLQRPAAGASALDIGAGDGALLAEFAAAGVPAGQLFGLEIEPGAVDRLTRRGYGAILGRVEEAPLGSARFDVISMIQVIEHIAEPARAVAACREALRDGGLLLIETPNLASWDRPLFGKRRWGGYHFPRHWTLWDTRSLPALLERHGFQVVHVSTPAAAVVQAWSLNHLAQDLGAPPWLAGLFGLRNPVVLAMLWALELIPSRLGRSANMRIIARAV